jgi:hypothetical protein
VQAVLERLLVERLLRRKHVPARRPRVSTAARDLSVAEVPRCDTRVRGCLFELLRRFVVELRRGFPTVVRHQSIFIATCLIWVYSSIE